MAELGAGADPLAQRTAQLRRGSILNLAAAVALVVPLYLACFVVAFLFDHARAGTWAALAVAALLVVGAVSQWRQAQDEWRIYQQPFVTWTGSTHAVNHMAGRVLGVAYVVSEFVTGSVTQLFRFAGKRRIAGLLAQLDPGRVQAFMDALRAKGTSPRFHPVTDFEVDDRTLVALALAEIIWRKEEDGVCRVGLNRAYD